MPALITDEDPDDEVTGDAATDAVTEGITEGGDDLYDRTSGDRGAPATNTDDPADDVDGLSEK